MSGQTLDYLLTFRADASQGKAEVQNLRNAIVGLHTEANRRDQQSLQGGNLGGLSEVAASTNQALIQTASVSAAAQAGLSGLSSTAPRVSTALGQVQAGVAGLTTSMSTQVEEMLTLQRANAAWRDQLNQVRAQFNPIFAASMQYEEQLRRIAQAEELGAISAIEAAQARDRAARMIAPVNQELAQNAKLARGAAHANAYFLAQFNDIGMMAAMGQNPAVLALQQGTQVTQMMSLMGGGRAAFSAMAGGLMSMLNPISLATIGIIGLGAAGIQALSGLREETVSFEDRLEDLDGTLGRMRGNLETLQNVHLGDTFGSFTSDVRGLAEGLLELDRAAELQQLSALTDSFLDDAAGETWLQGGLRALAGASGSLDLAEQSEQIKRGSIESNYRDLGAANSYADFQARTAEIADLATSGDVDAVITKLLALQQAMSGGDNVSTMSKELRTLLGQLAQTGIETARIEALWNGSAQAERVAKQIQQMVTGYSQQAELARVALAHGEQSAEVEALRNRHARDGLSTRLEALGVAEDSAEAAETLAALEALQIAKGKEADAARRASITDTIDGLSQELVIADAILRYGEESEAVERLRTQQAQETLQVRLSELGANQAQLDLAADLLASERERRRELDRSQAEQQAATLLQDLQSQEQIEQAILTHGRDSLQVRRLQIDAARTAFEQQIASLNISRETRDVLMEQWEATRGLASADPFGQASAAHELLSRQSQSLAQLQLEISLVGQSEAVRRRALAVYEAEVEIRRRGLDVGSAHADQIREQAAAAADLRSELERQVEAWDQVGSAAESVLDGPIDALLDGDFSGALQEVSKEIKATLVDLSIKNPIKNALFGSDLGTLQDVGGLGGLVASLFGAGDPTIASPAGLAKQAAAMAVTTPLATINAGALSGLDALVGGAGGDLLTGLGSVGLSGPEDVQRQIWDFFSGKGLAAHQVAAILGNVSAESGFNPLAVGDNGHAFGLFQHNDRSAALFDFIGGRQNLGNVQAQLEFAWQELLTSENGVLHRLLSSQNVYDANAAFIGFERPSGWSPSNPQGGHGWARRLASAEAAMTKFADTTTSATHNLGILGQGFDLFGSALGSVLQGGAGDGSGNALGDLFSDVFPVVGKLLGLPGFSIGGPTGGSDPSRIAGFVHETEYVFDGASTSRIGVANLETLRRGGSFMPAGAYAPPAAVSFQPVFNVINNSSRPTNVSLEPEPGSGGRAYRMVIADEIGAAMTQPGGGAQRVLRNRYNVKPVGTLR